MAVFMQTSSGLYVPHRSERRRPTAIDLFCGCGGFSLGLIQAGFEVVAAVDWDVAAMITYMVNLGSYPINIHFIDPEDEERMERYLEQQLVKTEGGVKVLKAVSGSARAGRRGDFPPVRNVWIGDVRKLTGEEILGGIGMERGEVDLVVGGPPCQGFSIAGRRQVMDPRNSLVFEFARLVLEIQPKALCMENVPGILSMVTPEGFPVMDEFCRVLEDGGFGTMQARKKQLLATSGAGAALRSGPGKKSPEPPEPEDQPDDDQITLFDLAEEAI